MTEAATVEAEETSDTPDVRTLSSEDLENYGIDTEEKELAKTETTETPTEKEPETAKPKEGAEKPDATDETQPDPVSNPELEALKAEHEKLKGRWENQEKLISRFGNEIGLMRKMTPEQTRIELDRIRDVWREDPIAGDEEMRKFRFRQQEDAHKEEAARIIQKVSSTKEALKQFVPEFDSGIDDLAGLIKEDGAGDEYVKAFRENPYLLDHTTLYNMHHRARLSKEVAGLKAELETLKIENEALKKKPGEMLKKIEDASRFKPESAANKGAASQSGTLYDKLPAKMTSEELKVAAKRAADKGD